jgi:hypothetical protein
MFDRTAQKNRYNKKCYDTILVRIRRNSPLANKLAAHKKNGRSVNSLILTLLAAHFGEAVPLAWYLTRKTETLIPRGE